MPYEYSNFLLSNSTATEIAQNSTQQLFESLRQSPPERYREILAHSGQVALLGSRRNAIARPIEQTKPKFERV